MSEKPDNVSFCFTIGEAQEISELGFNFATDFLNKINIPKYKDPYKQNIEFDFPREWFVKILSKPMVPETASVLLFLLERVLNPANRPPLEELTKLFKTEPEQLTERFYLHLENQDIETLLKEFCPITKKYYSETKIIHNSVFIWLKTIRDIIQIEIETMVDNAYKSSDVSFVCLFKYFFPKRIDAITEFWELIESKIPHIPSKKLGHFIDYIYDYPILKEIDKKQNLSKIQSAKYDWTLHDFWNAINKYKFKGTLEGYFLKCFRLYIVRKYDKTTKKPIIEKKTETTVHFIGEKPIYHQTVDFTEYDKKSKNQKDSERAIKSIQWEMMRKGMRKLAPDKTEQERDKILSDLLDYTSKPGKKKLTQNVMADAIRTTDRTLRERMKKLK